MNVWILSHVQQGIQLDRPLGEGTRDPINVFATLQRAMGYLTQNDSSIVGEQTYNEGHIKYFGVAHKDGRTSTYRVSEWEVWE